MKFDGSESKFMGKSVFLELVLYAQMDDSKPFVSSFENRWSCQFNAA